MGMFVYLMVKVPLSRKSYIDKKIISSESMKKNVEIYLKYTFKPYFSP